MHGLTRLRPRSICARVRASGRRARRRSSRPSSWAAARWCAACAERPQLSTPRQLATYLLPQYGAGAVEQFGIVMLDTKHRVIRVRIVSIGSLDSTVVHPREVFREAASASAAAIVLFHNHPSGDPTPSPDDLALTTQNGATPATSWASMSSIT